MLLGFKRQFEPFVQDGSKRHTIRALGKRRAFRVGDICDCYVDPRRKTMRLIGRWPCVKVEDIHIWVNRRVFIDGVRLSHDECDELAWRDGFRLPPKNSAFVQMMMFWEGRLPFHGQLIHWDYDHPVTREARRKRPARTSPKVSVTVKPVARLFNKKKGA